VGVQFTPLIAEDEIAAAVSRSSFGEVRPISMSTDWLSSEDLVAIRQSGAHWLSIDSK